MPAYIYILASRKHGTLYIGSTCDLFKRLEEHRDGIVLSFTQKYWVKKLVYFEVAETYYAALTRERRLKEWRRARKIELVEKMNPNWHNLIETIE